MADSIPDSYNAPTSGATKIQTARGNNMSPYKVRLYQDLDYLVVRKIFTHGCKEHTAKIFYYALTQPHNWLLLLVGFLLPLVTLGSALLSIIDVGIVLSVLWLSGRHFFHSYAKHALEEDMKDIPRYYLRREGCCFWVVESAGEVVGMVAAVTSRSPEGEKLVELKRMSVASSYRGKGVAKLLCRTLINFAQKTECDRVTLSTTTVQVDALKLYENMGFRLAHTELSTKFTDRLVGITWVIYKYDILARRAA